MYVRNNDQIIGLTNLLTLGVRVLTVIEAQMERELKARREVMQGLYAGSLCVTMCETTEANQLVSKAKESRYVSRIKFRIEFQ